MTGSPSPLHYTATGIRYGMVSYVEERGGKVYRLTWLQMIIAGTPLAVQ